MCVSRTRYLLVLFLTTKLRDDDNNNNNDKAEKRWPKKDEVK